MAGEVQHQRMTHRLSGQAAAATARQDRNSMFGGDLDRCCNLICIARECHADGHHLVDARIGAVKQACHAVEVHLRDLGSQLLDEILGGFRGLLGDHNAVNRIIDLLGRKGAERVSKDDGKLTLWKSRNNQPVHLHRCRCIIKEGVFCLYGCIESTKYWNQSRTSN